MKMKCLDLFSGIGGMGRLLPFEPVMFCEFADFPRSVLESRMKSGDLPNVPIHDDVRTLKPPDHDILIGGFPCQDISTLGLKKGLYGKKSSLYFQILRIIKLKHPQKVFLENVAHILHMPEVWHVVLRTLSEEGYDMKWCVFGANSCGAIHQRNRWFILATYTGIPCSVGLMPERMGKYGEMKGGTYSELPDPKVPRTRRSVPIVMKHLDGVPTRGTLCTKVVTRTLWMTPRATGGTRAIFNKTKRSMSDLPNQLRFAICTPDKDRHFCANLKWVENLMGLPAGWTDPECVHVEDFPGFGNEVYKRMLPDKIQRNYYKRWKTLGNMCVSQTALLAYEYLKSSDV
jgi:DNA-cytosine methyltransferase